MLSAETDGADLAVLIFCFFFFVFQGGSCGNELSRARGRLVDALSDGSVLRGIDRGCGSFAARFRVRNLT